MEKASDIAEGLVTVSKNRNVWLRSIGLIGVLTAAFSIGAVVFSKTKTKTIVEDCSYYKAQNDELVHALLAVKQIAAIKVNPRFNMSLMSAAYFIDTTPQQRRVYRYVDSVLREMRRKDSIYKYKKKKNDKSN